MGEQRVSVAICTYNGEEFIAEQLKSIIHQSRKVDEIIISDDQSDDRTLQVAIDLLQSSGISFSYYINDNRLSPGKNFISCIHKCTGDIVFLSDQDDIWEYDKVEKMLIPFKNENVALVFSDAFLIDSEKNKMEKTLSQRQLNGYSYDAWGIYLEDTAARVQKTPNGCLMAIRAKKMEPFLDEMILDWHDGWIFHAAALAGEYSYVAECLMSYRIHSSNLTVSPKAEAEYLQKIDECDTCDKYFSLHVFREARIMMFEKILDLCDSSNPYLDAYRKSCSVFRNLQKIKEMTRLGGVALLLNICIRGQYRYRYIDPVLPKGIRFHLRLVKMFFYDLLFCLKRR